MFKYLSKLQRHLQSAKHKEFEASLQNLTTHTQMVSSYKSY